MSVLDLFRRPRIVEARLVAAPIAIAGGRSAVHVVIEGAGVLVIGDLRQRFWNGFSGTVRAPIADAVGGAIAVRATNLAGTDERAVPFVPLPALASVPVPAPLPLSLPAHTPALPEPPRAPRIALRSLSVSVHPRGPS